MSLDQYHRTPPFTYTGMFGYRINVSEVIDGGQLKVKMSSGDCEIITDILVYHCRVCGKRFEFVEVEGVKSVGLCSDHLYLMHE